MYNKLGHIRVKSKSLLTFCNLRLLCFEGLILAIDIFAADSVNLRA